MSIMSKHSFGVWNTLSDDELSNQLEMAARGEPLVVYSVRSVIPIAQISYLSNKAAVIDLLPAFHSKLALYNTVNGSELFSDGTVLRLRRILEGN